MGKAHIFAILYATSATLSIFTVATSVTAWVHWDEILDNCYDADCGCILYGTSSPILFSGGPIQLCQFASFASVPTFILGVILGCYYGYQACISQKSIKKKRKEKRQAQRNSRLVVVTSAAEDRLNKDEYMSFKCWLLLILIVAINTPLLMANAVVLTGGYYASCSEYRQIIVKDIKAVTQVSSVIYDRLGCDAIFDFMDYLEPFTRPYSERDDEIYYARPGERRDHFRGEPIMSSVSLQIAITTAWLNFTLWLIVLFLYIMWYKKCICCK